MAAPFFGFAPPPIQKQNPLGFLVPATEGLLQGLEKRAFTQDLQGLAAGGQFDPKSQQGKQL